MMTALKLAEHVFTVSLSSHSRQTWHDAPRKKKNRIFSRHERRRENRVNWKWRNFSTKVARNFSLRKIKVARVGNYLWIECRRFIIFYAFLAKGNWWLLSLIHVSLNTFSSALFICVILPSLRSSNNAKWNQKFTHWFMWKYFSWY
jgi:hypothetical protein